MRQTCNIRTRALLLASALLAPSAFAAPIIYNDFSSTGGLTLNGNAAQSGNVLRLTPALDNQSGSAFSTTAITLGAGYTFSTFFAFQITDSAGIGDDDGEGADGLTFTIQTNSNTAGGLGGGLGYQDILNSVSIEFDTFDNGTTFYNDPNGNHVGINTGGAFGTATATVANRLNNGNVWYAWADYDGTTLQVRLSETLVRPSVAVVSSVVDLASELGTLNAFVGFTSGTGSGVGNHDILRWEFRDSFDPVIDPPNGVPLPASLWLLGLGALALSRATGAKRR
jgi:hypothetical protein